MKRGRRSFLRSLGLGAAGATLLGPLLGRFARADGTAPCRFVFVVEGNCFEPVTMLADGARAAIDGTASEPVGSRRWWYRRYGHDAPLIEDGGLASAPALGALSEHPEVAAQAAVLFGLSSRIVGGGHSAQHGVLASARTIGGVPGGPTIDAFLAALPQVRGTAPYDAVRLGVHPRLTEPLDFGTCAFARGRAAPLILQPGAAYNSLFGSVGSDAGRAAFEDRRSLLDFAADDVSAVLATFPGNSAERAKLETYLASVEELTARHERIRQLGPELEGSRPEAPDTNPLYLSEAPLDRFAAHLELATAALQGGLTNVAVVGSGTGGAFDLTYRTVNSSVGRHDLHHGSGGNAGFLADIHEVTRRQVVSLSAMAAQLAATPEAEADGSMLDHTVVVFIGDNGEQHHSTASEFPTLLLGGRNLGLRTGGRTVVFPGLSSGGHRQVSNLWNTLGYLTGEVVDRFGDEGPARRAEGPLEELLA